MTANLFGLSSAVIALIVHLSYRFAKLGMDDWLQWVIAADYCLLTIWREAEEVVLFIGRYSRQPLLWPVVSPRQHAGFRCSPAPVGTSAPPTLTASTADSLAVLFHWRVSDPQLVAATAVIALIVFPILPPTWVLVQ